MNSLARIKQALHRLNFHQVQPNSIAHRLFRLGVRVQEIAARIELEDCFEELLQLQWVKLESETVIANYRIHFENGHYLILDPDHGNPETLTVMPPSGSTRSLLHSMSCKPSRMTLELGCGCGLISFVAAANSEKVIAIDLNPRAIRLAKWSAELNDISNIKFIQGSWFEPVEGQQFDLILCNPPFVISPKNQILYQHGGLSGDALSERLVRTSPTYLNTGGIAQILINWGINQDGVEGIEQWLQDHPCQIFLNRFSIFEIEEYIHHWLGEASSQSEYQEWIDYYANLGYCQIGTGLIHLTKL